MPDPGNTPLPPKIAADSQAIEAFCAQYGVKELALFGSVLREDFDDQSNVDILVEFLPGHGFTFDNTPDIIDDLTQIFGRRVDVVEARCIRNTYRRDAIMRSKRVIYAR
jgi:predicted nucleotidyltransferase